VILKWPIFPQKFKIRQTYNGKIEISQKKKKIEKMNKLGNNFHMGG
jgi:hypothetical protein